MQGSSHGSCSYWGPSLQWGNTQPANNNMPPNNHNISNSLDAEWSDLPGDVLSVIGSLMSCPNQLSSATRVCKAWKQGIPAGVEKLELDMNPCNQAWGAKVEQLQRLTPSLARCKAHVSTAVPKTAFGANIRQLASKLKNIQVGADVGVRLDGGIVVPLPCPRPTWQRVAVDRPFGSAHATDKVWRLCSPAHSHG